MKKTKKKTKPTNTEVVYFTEKINSIEYGISNINALLVPYFSIDDISINLSPSVTREGAIDKLKKLNHALEILCSPHSNNGKIFPVEIK